MIKLVPIENSLQDVYYNDNLLGEVDGYYVLELTKGCWGEFELRLLADTLKNLNKDWNVL